MAYYFTCKKNSINKVSTISYFSIYIYFNRLCSVMPSAWSLVEYYEYDTFYKSVSSANRVIL